MKLKFSLLAVLISSISMFGQNFEKLLYSKKNQPTIIINEKIIANWEMINSLPKDAIKEIEFISPNEEDLNEDKIIIIWTLTKDKRLASSDRSKNEVQKNN